MPFVYFNFQQEISIYFTILTFSLSCFTFNIGDFLRHETILAVSRTVSHAALPVPSQESQKIPVCNISRVYCDVTKVSRPGLSSQNRSGPGITRRGERHKRVSSDSGKLRHNHRVVMCLLYNCQNIITLLNTFYMNFIIHPSIDNFLDSVSQLSVFRVCVDPSLQQWRPGGPGRVQAQEARSESYKAGPGRVSCHQSAPGLRRMTESAARVS